jgi:putative ABC transport system substrate-binding protein
LTALGHVENNTIEYVFRPPAKEGAGFDDLAADLVRLNVNVIVATGTAAIAAAKRATQSTPIVMCPTSDPVGLGFVASLAHPGGNLTGIALQYEDTTGKRLQLLREMVPQATRVAFIWSSGGSKQLEAAQAVAPKLGVRLQPLEVSTQEGLPAAFEAAVKGGAEALMVVSTPLLFGMRSQVAALASKHRLPAIYPLPANADAGGLMTYGPNDSEYYRQAAVFVDKILKGAKPADLPVEQPTKFELAINRKAAKALGLTIPQSLLISADRVIE